MVGIFRLFCCCSSFVPSPPPIITSFSCTSSSSSPFTADVVVLAIFEVLFVIVRLCCAPLAPPSPSPTLFNMSPSSSSSSSPSTARTPFGLSFQSLFVGSRLIRVPSLPYFYRSLAVPFVYSSEEPNTLFIVPLVVFSSRTPPAIQHRRCILPRHQRRGNQIVRDGLPPVLLRLPR